MAARERREATTPAARDARATVQAARRPDEERRAREREAAPRRAPGLQAATDSEGFAGEDRRGVVATCCLRPATGGGKVTVRAARLPTAVRAQDFTDEDRTAGASPRAAPALALGSSSRGRPAPRGGEDCTAPLATPIAAPGHPEEGCDRARDDS